MVLNSIIYVTKSMQASGFKNHEGRRVDYPWRPMHIEASICNADRGEVDWSQAPFSTHYQDFDFNACPTQINIILQCNSKKYFWNNLKLNAKQKQKSDTEDRYEI
ncbi:xyloglucan endotransglucosylase/hydrolase protein 3-like [Olea europaea var. sylvestris]|uniref:xyloglucan endotransglucosylase/hydrolase protein 3-like n=1 Tax=Olea europaea var. sylvestris TaxID=158386 RepID=UPI000C1D10E3|nr:xyloglucan endotransglucosylase/hydrolase protein 3-like [Olea europaea var. sylvestris]